MNSNDVIEILNFLNRAEIETWIDGGWGIDALVNCQTRVHSDLDLVISLDQVQTIKKVLGTIGFAVYEDELPTRFVMKDSCARFIDFHPVTFNETGGGIQKLQDKSSFQYPVQGFSGRGLINGKKVKCLTAQVQAECHYGYQPNEKDKHDMKLLHEHFSIELKFPYRD